MPENSTWTVTDPSCNQQRKTISETLYVFREDRIVNPVTKETEPFEAEINLEDYTWTEIVDYCSPFGYSAKQVDDWLTCGEHLELIAECIFEMTND